MDNTISKNVTIGNQVWMTRNLDVSTFRNGEPIPEARTDVEWEKAREERSPSWCYYENDDVFNGVKYGKLYNWYAVSDPRGLAPKGWHIPNDQEWAVLTNYLGGEEEAGAKMKSKHGWPLGDNGTNSSNFLGLQGGRRSSIGEFSDLLWGGFLWSSTGELISGGSANFLYLAYNGPAFKFDSLKGVGMSVRCLRD